MTPVLIATKPYIKEWLYNAMPEQHVNRNTAVGCFLYKLLEKDTDHQGSKMVSYAARATLYINSDARSRHGGWLNVTQTMRFNKFVGQMIRNEIRTYVVTYMHFDPRLKKAIEYARQMTGIDEDAYAEEAIIKEFQRWRKKNGGPRIYNKLVPTVTQAAA